MILVAGVPTEPPVEELARALQARGADFIVLNQRRFAEMEIGASIDSAGCVDGLLRIGRRQWRLSEISAAYVRLMDDRLLPEIRKLPDQSPARHACRQFHEALTAWLEVATARIVNRLGPMASNGSKPFQAQRITAHGFETPETLITNDPDEARSFVSRIGEVVYKSISGTRSIVQKLSKDDLDRLDEIRICPVQFQSYVRGTDVRVHVLGGETFAAEIVSEATDYRYATRQAGAPPVMRAIELPTNVAGRCISLTADLGLEFAGIDLSFTEDGRIVCFEVNPSPAYTYFEAGAGQPIAGALARLLMS